MIITNDKELEGMQRASEAVATTLKMMRNFAAPGMSTKDLDEYGGQILGSFGARSAPYLTYKFPGHSCISLNEEVAHGIPSSERILKEGDLLNIDVSAELEGYWSDNGGSFVVGEDIFGHKKLVATSQLILKEAIARISGGVKINAIGEFIEKEAKRNGFTVIKNLGGHGIGRGLHEQPHDILNYKDRLDQRRFRKNTIVAVETFISTASTLAVEQTDGFTMLGNRGGYVAQHEHTIMITESRPVILTTENGIWDF
ncbi:type I methionyl aminopeptidase [Desertivirga xinjiangensis]|uniref:type I methionyl aminopeptidase n=1 Tax=Desertivirga xinjiangensis TaxID=539206 RepID=UPI00210C6515|nr:type I methionyl aminopeptidase [Pedobacter xinjiangensis]